MQYIIHVDFTKIKIDICCLLIFPIALPTSVSKKSKKDNYR